jgi:hypothetical protein
VALDCYLFLDSGYFLQVVGRAEGQQLDRTMDRHFRGEEINLAGEGGSYHPFEIILAILSNLVDI